MTDRFRIHDGVPLRLNSEGEEVGPDRSDQPNPEFVDNPGIHGWDGVSRIDIAPDVAPGDEIIIPSIEVTPEAGNDTDGRSLQVGVSSMDVPVRKFGPHVVF